MKRAIKRKLKLLDLALLRDTKKCIFCGSVAVTKEHVFSKRFHKYMDSPRAKRAVGLITALTSKKSEQVSFKLRGSMRDWQIKCVCGGDTSTCNNGWMRELDESMESVGKRLIRLPSNEEQFRLYERDQRIIATWAIMKVMVTHNSMVHHMQRRMLRRRQSPPDGWGVWIGHYIRGEDWLPEFSTTPFPLVRTPVVRRKTRANSHATTMVFQHLFVHVIYLREHSFAAKWKFPSPSDNPFAGHLYRIWPLPGHSFFWPGNTITDKEAECFSMAVFRSYQAVAEKLGLMPTNLPITEL
jgi:hypothetical protein